VQKETTTAQQAGGAEAEAGEARETTTAQQAGGAEAEAGEAREAEGVAPEPDKLTKAQPAAGDEADAAEAPEPGSDEAPEGGPDEEPEQAVTERADEADAEHAGGEGEAAEVAPAAAEGATIAADLDAARAEAESYLDDLRRLQADFDNYRKRTLREQTARAASASQALVTRLLPVLDNFELAVSAAEQSRDFDRMLKGVEMVFGEFREVLQGEGLVTIEAEGKPFDPERHEAVVAVEQEGSEPGTVVDIVRTGYELRGKVLRPAMVKVAK
jgi:molecular chaperone GrpE